MCPRLTSDAQWIANRLNALKSTGPRTASGRRRSSLNAVKHGLSQPLSTLDQHVQDVVELLAPDVSDEAATHLALRIVELERTEQTAREVMLTSFAQKTSVIDRVTGIPITDDLLRELPKHFSQSQIQQLMDRAVEQKDPFDVNDVVTALQSCERYLKRASNQMTRHVRQAFRK